jgi:RHS repeat-associated protein
VRFTGQHEESGLAGLYFYDARWYDPYINRWIQPDTIVPNAGSPQSLNRFSYSYNNPLKYVDPDGHDPISFAIVMILAALVLSGDVPNNPSMQALTTAQSGVNDIAASAPTSADALVTMFASDGLPGDSAPQRFETILMATNSGTGQYFSGEFGDSGFRAELQDSGLPGGGDQVGHFLQGAAMSYRSDNQFSDVVMLSLVTGHEIVGDAGASGPTRAYNNLSQGIAGANPQAHRWFLEGTDDGFANILSLGSGNRTGNSMQDLRLSYRAWLFGKMLQDGRLTNRSDAASWLTEHLMDAE